VVVVMETRANWGRRGSREMIKTRGGLRVVRVVTGGVWMCG